MIACECYNYSLGGKAKHLFFGPLVAGEEVRDDTFLSGVSVSGQVHGAARRHVDQVVSGLRYQQTVEQSLEHADQTV